jgi:membrane protein insertase Oxa1/YidC/SpoIIIJ
MNPYIIIYGLIAGVIAILYTKYYVKSHREQYKFLADDPKEFRKMMLQITIIVFIFSFLFAPVVLANKIYDLVQF